MSVNSVVEPIDLPGIKMCFVVSYFIRLIRFVILLFGLVYGVLLFYVVVLRFPVGASYGWCFRSRWWFGIVLVVFVGVYFVDCVLL